MASDTTDSTNSALSGATCSIGAVSLVSTAPTIGIAPPSALPLGDVVR